MSGQEQDRRGAKKRLILNDTVYDTIYHIKNISTKRSKNHAQTRMSEDSDMEN